jgi:hypothetical protein
MNCPDCEYLRLEREAIHIFDGGATPEEAVAMAAGTRCREHAQLELEIPCPELLTRNTWRTLRVGA